MVKEFLKVYFKVITVMAIPIAFMTLVSVMLCDLLWYGGYIGYSNTIYYTIAVICGIVMGILIAIVGYNTVIAKNWSFKIGAK